MKIVIEGELPDLNTDISIIRSHKFAYADHKAKWTYYVANFVRKHKIPQITVPIKPKFYWYTKDSRKDCDNITYAKKYILDGLKQAGVIKDDSRKYIVGFAGDEFIVDKENPRVEIEIEV